MADLSALQANRAAPPVLDLIAVMCPVCAEQTGYDSARGGRFFCNTCEIQWDANGIDVDYELAGEWVGEVSGR